MFEIKQASNNGDWCIIERLGYKGTDYLHSNGRVFRNCAEYFPTKETAQEVLDKFQLPHKWEHGDVFESGNPFNRGIMMYVSQRCREPQLIYLDLTVPVCSSIESYLKNAKFLFNIKEKI